MTEAAKLRSILTDIAVPILLAGPLSFFFLIKLRDLAIANQNQTTTLGAMAQGLSCFDENQRLTIWNAKYAELFCMEPHLVHSGITLFELLSLQQKQGNVDGEAGLLQRSIIAKVKAGQPFGNETRLASGRLIWSMHMPAPDGGWVATHDDVTAERAQQSMLSAQNIRLAAVIGNMRQAVCMFDGEGRLVTCNDNFGDLYRLPEHLAKAGALRDAIEGHLVEARLIPGASVAHQLFRPAAASQEQTIELVDGRFVRVIGSAMPDGGYVSTHEDVTERRLIEAQIEHDALHDALTGLPNRRFLDLELARRKEECARTGRGMALLHIDLDRFKQINDTLGHGAGDAMLCHTADLLRANLRDADFVARIGGDEFLVVCDYSGRSTKLGALSRRVISRMRKRVNFDGNDCRLGVSIGISHEIGPDLNSKRLLVGADLALYHAKTAGGGRCVFYDESMRLQIEKRKEVTDDVILGVERGEFVTHYQVKVDAKTKLISGIEALVRWQHPVRGLLPPSEFLSVADDLDLVSRIDEIVMLQALQQLAIWDTRGFRVPNISVNVSSRRLSDPNLFKQLRDVSIPSGRLSFELLESIYLDDIDYVVKNNLQKIRSMGIGIDIDDFGTGRASMLALSRLRPDKLKIDRNFVSSILESNEQRQLIQWIIAIGHSLSVQVVAEGVENDQQAQLLASMGCNELQGYAFGRPVDGDEMTVILEHWQWSLDNAVA
jgi:diguanylate cyclase (GGDEF)-like protein